jgi:hypothetical protein
MRPVTRDSNAPGSGLPLDGSAPLALLLVDSIGGVAGSFKVRAIGMESEIRHLAAKFTAPSVRLQSAKNNGVAAGQCEHHVIEHAARRHRTGYPRLTYST